MQNLPSKKIILAQTFIIFVLPIFLLYFHILPMNWRFILLAVSSLLIYGIIKREDWSFEDMGVRHDNFKKATPFYLVFTILGLAALFIIANKAGFPDNDTPAFLIKTWVFFLPVSFFQEFAFRSFLMPRLKMIYQKKYLIVLVNAVLFTLLHIIYPNLGLILPLMFVSGILFAWLYYKYPNLILVSVSHSILNVTAMLLGFFPMS